MKSVWQWGKSRASPVKRPILRFVDRPLNDQSCNLPISREMTPSCDLTIFRAMTQKNEQWKAFDNEGRAEHPPWNAQSWNRQITAWAFYREIVKLQHGPSAVKSWNHRTDRLAWNRQIIAWANCREIVKLQHEPIALKMSEFGLARFCGLDLVNILGDVLLVIRATILFVWI